MRARLFSLLLLGPAVAAGDPPVDPPAPSSATVAEAGPATAASPASAPAATQVYGFDDVTTTSCVEIEGGVYHDLTFVPASAFAVCSDVMIGRAGDGGLLGLDAPSAEGRVILGAPTDHVEIQAYPVTSFLPTVLRAYDEAGVLVGSVSADQAQVWRPLAVRAPEGRLIASIGLTGHAVLDDLAVAGSDPTTAAECRNGGWAAFAFSNQGQCVRFVRTGKDSRP